jgi:hypothetical protein
LYGKLLRLGDFESMSIFLRTDDTTYV